jgi:DNA-binding transcriptional LysR family regulator
MEEIDVEALARADINLLVALEALMQERSVTRAAKRLALSQPAMSHTLRRLRDLFDDELFVRVGQEMTPTPRAVEMMEGVRTALRELGAVLDSASPFRPGEARATFRISAFDFAQVMLLPRVARLVTARAPNVRIVVRPYDQDPARALADGRCDLVIGLRREPQDPCHRVLSSERLASVVRRDHPCLAEAWTVESFAALSHAVVSPVGRGSGFVDAALARAGLARTVAFTTPQLFSAALAVSQSDMILTGVERQLEGIARLLPVALLPPPLELPVFDVAMTWHERRATDALHRFLRDLVVEAAASITAELR